MIDKTKELHELAELYSSYCREISEYHELLRDSIRPWCEENEEIKLAQKEAELAIRKYVDLLADLYYGMENELSEVIHKSK